MSTPTAELESVQYFPDPLLSTATMKLALPTDLEILEALADGKRNTAANLAYILDKDRSYINTRLPILADYDLLERVGPAPNSGLYEITERGAIVAEHGEKYSEDDVDFDSFVEERLDTGTD